MRPRPDGPANAHFNNTDAGRECRRPTLQIRMCRIFGVYFMTVRSTIVKLLEIGVLVFFPITEKLPNIKIFVGLMTNVLVNSESCSSGSMVVYDSLSFL